MIQHEDFTNISDRLNKIQTDLLWLHAEINEKRRPPSVLLEEFTIGYIELSYDSITQVKHTLSNYQGEANG